MSEKFENFNDNVSEEVNLIFIVLFCLLISLFHTVFGFGTTTNHVLFPDYSDIYM